MNKQRSESILGHHDLSQTKEDEIFPEQQEGKERADVIGSLGGRRGMFGGLGGISLRPPGDYLDAHGRSDIMAQSMRRQSLRGSKQNLLDGTYGSLDSNGSSRQSLDAVSPEEFLVFRADGPLTEDQYKETKRKNLPKFIPSSHEDIQILNLQGFMDPTSLMGDLGNANRRKLKKKKFKRGTDTGSREAYKFTAKPRRKRNHKLSKSHLSDDDGEMVLKDIDDLDSKVAGLVLGPENPSKESTGRPITLEEASDLRNLLTGSPAQPLPTEWLTQNFKQNTNPNLSYGIVQKKVRRLSVSFVVY